MIALLLSPLGKFFAVIALITALAIGAKLWLSEHDKNTLAGYVALSEKEAADKKAQEAQRQAKAAAEALASANEQIASAKAAEAKANVEMEQRITGYEKQLVDAKRACLLDRADIVVLQHGAGKVAPVGHR